jgi:hypothetical protein
MARNYLQGTFVPLNPHKYVGDVNKIIFRSSWEKRFFIWCDTNDSVVKWNSEELVIPYVSPKDSKAHRYFVDAVVQIRDKNNNLNMYAVEIKPKSQVEMPKPVKRVTKRYVEAMETYSVNQAKWAAAKEWCKSNKLEFLVLTEVDLGISK